MDENVRLVSLKVTKETASPGVLRGIYYHLHTSLAITAEFDTTGKCTDFLLNLLAKRLAFYLKSKVAY